VHLESGPFIVGRRGHTLGTNDDDDDDGNNDGTRAMQQHKNCLLNCLIIQYRTQATRRSQRERLIDVLLKVIDSGSYLPYHYGSLHCR